MRRDTYDATLAHGLSVTGEDREYFARGRIAWLATHLDKLREQPRSILDFGCGTGDSTVLLAELLGADVLLGVDVSGKSIEAAASHHGSARLKFAPLDRYQPKEEFDLAYCNGVFHHIPEHARLEAVHYVRRCLRPGGLFAFCDNNPWNPGTRFVMRRIPFDRDAIMLSARQARRLLQNGGFEILGTSFLFVFPRALRFLRRWKARLARWPLGGQYQILGRRQASAA